VPTVLTALLQHVDASGGDLSSLRSGTWGGSTVPRSLMEGFERHGVRIWHAWAMTETSPILTVARPPAGVQDRENDWAYRSTQGRMVPWTELRLSDGTNEIEARGPWVAERYFEGLSGDDKFTDDGWLRTGDIGEIDDRRYVRITDRAKDLIKTGGQWIASVEVETLLLDNPCRAGGRGHRDAGRAVGRAPLACVALAEGAGASPSQRREHLSSGLASWQLPDASAFIDEVPKTSVGKFDKKALRRALAGGELPVERSEAVR
jgi:fatty-acyl-CoA synthase